MVCSFTCLDNLISKVEIFGMHFASLDVRQDSSVHGKVLGLLAEHESGLPVAYTSFSEAEKMKALQSISAVAE
jgi:phosphoenolpyruvate carboxylase